MISTSRVGAALAGLWAAYRTLSRGRDARDPLDLDIPERKVIVGKDGAIEKIVVPERLEAHRLIEEFMIQANVAAAETLEAKKSPLVYRIHDAPSLAKLEALREFLASIELSLPKSGNLRPSHFNRILARAAKAPSMDRSSMRWCCGRRRRPSTARKTSGISASTSAATPISPRRSGAMPTSSSIAR